MPLASLHVLPHPGGLWTLLTEGEPGRTTFYSCVRAMAEARRQADQRGFARIRLYRFDGGVETEYHVVSDVIRAHDSRFPAVRAPIRGLRARLRTPSHLLLP